MIRDSSLDSYHFVARENLVSDAKPFSVIRVAELARIHVPKESIDDLEDQFLSILEFVEKISELDLDQVEPFFGQPSTSQPIRDDVPVRGLEQEQTLANAPSTDGEFFHVPSVFGSDLEQPENRNT